MKMDGPSVKVPVLSEHKTFILPKFSMEDNRLTITFSAAMFLAPRDRLTLIIAGKSCGGKPTARAMENKKESKTGRAK